MKRRSMMKTVVIGALGAATLSTGEAAVQPGTQVRVKPKPLEDRDLAFWLESSLCRVFPNSEPGSAAPLKLLAAQNERPSRSRPVCATARRPWFAFVRRWKVRRT